MSVRIYGIEPVWFVPLGERAAIRRGEIEDGEAMAYQFVPPSAYRSNEILHSVGLLGARQVTDFDLAAAAERVISALAEEYPAEEGIAVARAALSRYIARLRNRLDDTPVDPADAVRVDACLSICRQHSAQFAQLDAERASFRRLEAIEGARLCLVDWRNIRRNGEPVEFVKALDGGLDRSRYSLIPLAHRQELEVEILRALRLSEADRKNSFAPPSSHLTATNSTAAKSSRSTRRRAKATGG